MLSAVLHQVGTFFDWEVCVQPVVAMCSESFFELGQQTVHSGFLSRQQFQQGETSEDAVPLGNVTVKPDPTALLKAEQDIPLLHLGADVLEANPGLEQFQPVRLAHPIDHRGGCQRLDHPARLSAVHAVVMQ